MNALTEKVVKTALLLAMPATFITVAYLLNDQPVPQPLVEDSVLYSDTNLQPVDSVQLSKIQAAINRELDSVERFPTRDSFGTVYNNTTSGTKPETSLSAGQSYVSPAQNDKAAMPVNDALQGPFALFTRTYSLKVGKPVPVSVLWTSDSALLPTKFQLVTITLNDIADNKAGFTLSDPSAVLLYSGANYAVNDKISIEDENHNLHISVLQVRPDSVKIELASYLNDKLVSKLKEWQ